MRRLINRTTAVTILILAMVFAVTALPAHADEKKIVTADEVLKLKITREDGINITPQEKEQICTCMPLKYEPDAREMPELFKYRIGENEKDRVVDSLLKHDIECQYSLSSDGGVSFSDWTSMAGNVFVLSPGAVSDGEYCIKFRKLDSYRVEVPKREETTVSGNTVTVAANNAGVSGNTVTLSEKLAAAYCDPAGGDGDDTQPDEDGSDTPTEADIKKAEKIALSEPCHAVESAVYYVWLDFTPPTLELESDKDFDVWTSSDIKCRVTYNDAGTKPKRISVRCGEDTILDETCEGGSYCGDGREFVLSKESASEKGDELTIQVYDRAGNVSTLNRIVKIDRTAPSVELEGADNGGIYSASPRLRVKGEDAHPSTVCLGYKVIRTVDGSEETAAESAGTLSDLKDKVLFEAGADGDYRIELKAKDAAGNESPKYSRYFRVDTTGPSVCFDGIADGAVLNTDGELKVNVGDNFDDPCKVSLSGTVLSAGTTRDLKMTEYKVNGRYSTNTYSFKADGEYSVTASATDAAGNTCSDSISFMVDKTAPVVEMINGFKSSDEVVLNSPPTLSFRITESNYETASVSCELKHIEDDKQVKCDTPEWIMSSSKSDFNVTIDNEGTYELNVRASDMAGNRAGKSLKFTLDTTKPEIDYIDDLNRKYVKSFKLPDNFTDYIKDESGVDYRAYVNSENYDEGSEINEDGKYVLKVIAVDDAGNQAEKTVEFIVDGTAPRVVIEGMDDDGSVNKDDVLILSLYDEEDYFTSVKLNGQELITDDKQKTVEVKIPEYGEYTIDITASDMAENVLTQTIDAKCANSSPVEKGTATVRTLKKNAKPGHNKGIRILLIALTVIVLAGAVVTYCLYVTGTGGDKKKVSIKAQSLV
ncbi:MAG: hypothetical protein K5868_10715 [Lachnospiraceae bacterium]|nr:hypothetical protein [Lachnospiraceae bacterium]